MCSRTRARRSIQKPLRCRTFVPPHHCAHRSSLTLPRPTTTTTTGGLHAKTTRCCTCAAIASDAFGTERRRMRDVCARARAKQKLHASYARNFIIFVPPNTTRFVSSLVAMDSLPIARWLANIVFFFAAQSHSAKRIALPRTRFPCARPDHRHNFNPTKKHTQ